MLRSEPATTRAEAVIAALRKHRILGNAPTEELQAMVRRSMLVTVPEREKLFSEGDEGRAAVVVLQGYVKLCSITAAGREVVLEVCGPGSLFGELAVLNGWPRAADAVAVSRCQVLSISGEALRTILMRSPEALFALLGVISRRLREATELFKDGADLPGPARLAKALGQLAATHAYPVENGGLRIDVLLSQRELGALTGLSRESINKQLAAWRDKGWIGLSDGQITLLDAEALRTLALEGSTRGSGESPARAEEWEAARPRK